LRLGRSLIGRSNRLRDLLPLLPHLENALLVLKPGQLIEVDATGFMIISPGKGP
jgi:hypothetical protein